MKNLLLSLIRLYQKLSFWPSPCRFLPSCSDYSYLAIEKYGILRGLSLSFRRIIRCQPFAKGGIDNLP